MADDTYVRGLVLRMTQLIVSHPTVVVVESDRDADSVIFVVSVDPCDMASLGCWLQWNAATGCNVMALPQFW